MSDWSSFANEAREATPGKGPRCRVSVLLADLPEHAQIELRKALDNKLLTSSGIAKALRKRLGETAPSQYSIANHRRGDCRCSS